jgi:hypothetical protein
MRRLVFEIHVTVKWGNTPQQCYLSRRYIKRIVGSTQDTQCTAGLSCDRMIMEYTHDEYRHMLLTLGACNSRAGTDAREYAVRYPGWRHPDANVFRRLEQRLHVTGSVTSTPLANAGRSRTVRTPANEDAILQLWNESRGEAHAISHDNWDYPNRGSSKYFMAINCVHTTTRGAHICFQTIVLYGCNFTNGNDINTLRMSSFLHNILWTDEACFTREVVFNVHNSHLWARDNPHVIRERGYKPSSASAFRLVSSGTLSWTPICYPTGWLLNDIVVFWNLFYRVCLKVCF